MTARQIRKPKSRLKKAFHREGLQLSIPAGFNFFLHGRKGRPTGRFNGDNDRAFNKGAIQEADLSIVHAFGNHFSVMTALPMSMIKATPSP